MYRTLAQAELRNKIETLYYIIMSLSLVALLIQQNDYISQYENKNVVKHLLDGYKTQLNKILGFRFEILI